ncbi:MAG: radical SAM protein [Anaerolineales bacterium]|nr:radical SAM protein [Anaerolineales bacterium]
MKIHTADSLNASAQAAQLHLRDCRLCPFDCGPVRTTAQGVCRVGDQSHIASEMLHMGEESLLRPAHAIFFSGCTATCTFCTAARFAFHPTYGVTVTPEKLAGRILQRQAEGAASVCFIGGDPTPHIPFILATLAAAGERRTIPAVFNSNLYLSETALESARRSDRHLSARPEVWACRWTGGLWRADRRYAAVLGARDALHRPRPRPQPAGDRAPSPDAGTFRLLYRAGFDLARNAAGHRGQPADTISAPSARPGSWRAVTQAEITAVQSLAARLGLCLVS